VPEAELSRVSMPVVVRKASTTDLSQLAGALSRAFVDDPVMSFILPRERGRLHRIQVLFELQLKRVHLPHQECYTTADIAGGALWAPPDQWRMPVVTVLQSLPRIVPLLGARLPVALKAISAIERVHPRAPHWYLAVLGTEPAQQGHGVGSALLQPVLERCDREGLPAYLESSKEANLAFYARHGFEVTDTIALPRGGPPVWPMWRDPRS
jgi:GNAT superfamily N-acetyltransferase